MLPTNDRKSQKMFALLSKQYHQLRAPLIACKLPLTFMRFWRSYRIRCKSLVVRRDTKIQIVSKPAILYAICKFMRLFLWLSKKLPASQAGISLTLCKEIYLGTSSTMFSYLENDRAKIDATTFFTNEDHQPKISQRHSV